MSAAGLEVRPVRTHRERRLFLTFPWRIYRGDPLWVAPLLPGRARTLDPRRGAFFRRGEAELFLAWRGRTPVGTVCAGVDRERNAASGRREGLFGFFECLEEYPIAEALLRQAARWARERDLDRLEGPYNLDYEDGYGVLVEGRDRPPALLCGHTPPYYRHYLERFGFRPARGDNLAYAIDLDGGTVPMRRLARLAARVRRQGRFSIRSPDLGRWTEEIDTVHDLLNRALAHLPGHRPWTRSAVEAILKPLARIADPALILFVQEGGRTVGWFPGLPNLNEALRHANGLRLPWDYPRLLWHLRRRPRSLTIKSVLILPEYWGSGAALLLFDEMGRRARERGYAWADLSLTSDDNPFTPALATRLGARLYKRYRVYQLDLA